MTVRRRAAFTLIQLLVIIAILALLLGMLLPAVMKVREAANRMTSQNNLKQIALAAINYEAAFAEFPPGSDQSNLSATVRLLPYVEQSAAYQQVDFTKDVTDEANANVRRMRFAVFISPRDPQQAVKDELGPTNYQLCAGLQADMKDNDGVFFQDSKVRFADITDGTSRTIMLGETLKGDGSTKAVDVKRQHVALGADALKGLKDDAGAQDFQNNQHIAGDRGASWMDGRFLQATFNGRLPPNDSRPDVTCAGQGGNSALRSLDNIVNIGLCDGSVRSVVNQIDVATWKALCTRNGGEALDF